MSKQTAVEWLITELKLNDTIEKENLIIAKQIIEEAKAMEKEQIVEAYDNGYDLRDDMGSLSSNPKGEQYYNQTYGGQDG